MSGSAFSRLRQSVLADVQGEVLEIGFGTGLNLPYYPQSITKITTVDANSGMNSLANRRIQAGDRAVKLYTLSAEKLPFADCSFDSVVSTWTLCSIPDVHQALAEIYRVLKPGGKLFFIEHGLSNEPSVQTWQHRLTPIQKIIADGCHLDRNIQALMEQHFSQVSVEAFYQEGLPKFSAYFYKGMALKV
jgi:ubiquinone/menaquinone biosynthesis C-methylase UbiE